MELSRLAMIVSFLAGAVLATPVGLPAGPPVIIRVFPSVRVCKDVNFGPPCNTVLSNYNECGKFLFNARGATTKPPNNKIVG